MTDDYSETVFSVHNRQLSIGADSSCDCMNKKAQDQARQNPGTQGGGR